jgi:ATP-dependent RNA helicase DDX49/DBP8
VDEADRLLTPTFASELSHLFAVLPKDRQTSLFTATLTPSIDALANAPPRPGKQIPFIHRMTETLVTLVLEIAPVLTPLARVETVSTLKQHYILVPSHVRELYLYYLLCNPPESTIPMRRSPPEPTKRSRKPMANAKPRQKAKPWASDDDSPEQPPPTIIFCARARTAAYLTNLLQSLSLRSTALHSGLSQRERLSSLSLFRAAVVPVLVSTDVGARGLDIEEVAMVINWDMPKEPEEYTHRVGRTARAGRGGVAVSFVTERDEERVLKIETRISECLLLGLVVQVSDTLCRDAARRNDDGRGQGVG